MTNDDFSRLSRPRYPMPEYVKEVLVERGLWDAYKSRPPYQQNDYIGWITRAKREQMIRDGIEVERLDPIEKARRNPRSLRFAINAKCWDCVGAGADPNPRLRIRECPCSCCPLYPVRPYQRKSNG